MCDRAPMILLFKPKIKFKKKDTNKQGGGEKVQVETKHTINTQLKKLRYILIMSAILEERGGSRRWPWYLVWILF